MPDNERNEPTPEEIKYVLQQAILRNYPNPERRGCPGAEAIRAVAELRLPHEDPHWQHVSHCSPCYQEFLERRGGVLEQRRSRRRLRAVALTAAACVLLAAAIVLTLRTGERRAPPPSVAKESPTPRATPAPSPGPAVLTAVLNFESESVTRGSDARPPSARDLQRVPRGRVALLIYLPLGSEPGAYEVQLRRRESDATPLASFAGTAELNEGLTALRITPDLSQFQPGTYALAFRRGTESWHYHQVVLF